METLTDQELLALLQTGEGLPLLSANYQDAVGREEFRILVNDNHLKYLKTPNATNLEMWSTEKYSTNFSGEGWCIFVMSCRLKARSTRTATTRRAAGSIQRSGEANRLRPLENCGLSL